MRIGIFHSTLPEPERKPGGVELFVHRLANHLALGHEVTCFTYSAIPNDAEYRAVRLSPQERGKRRISRLTTVPLALHRLDRRVREELDVLHLHGDDWFYMRRTLPTVRTFYGSAFWEAVHARRFRGYLLFALATPLEVCASRLATASYGTIPGHARLYRTAGTLPIGTDIPPHPPKVEERPAPPSILFVGTWSGRKRGRLLHETFLREVRPRIPHAELWMVSDRCDPGLGVKWFQRPTDEELRSLYERAWVFCSTSVYEGFGIPALEALAHGVPVVSTPNPGIQHVAAGGPCAVLARDSQLGPRLVALLSNRYHREQLALAGRHRAEAFSWERIVAEHERAYSEAIERWNAKHLKSAPPCR